MFNIWTQDIYAALAVLKEKCPNRLLVNCIGGNYYGDVLIKTEDAHFTYKVKEKELYIYIGTWKQGHWEKL